MKKSIFILYCLILGVTPMHSQQNDIYSTSLGALKITPALHGSFVLEINELTIIVDPYGGAQKYTSFASPNMILITDIHGDHLNQETLDGIDTKNTQFIVPKAVQDKLPQTYKTTILENGQGVHRSQLFIEAIPMYNLPEVENSKHPKGRGNGYLLTIGDTALYISGDTEDIQEMRMLRNIDIAFVCMNLPYTMDIHQAASAVLDFNPTVVYPYHYRGKDQMSDVNQFKRLITSKNSNIDVKLRDWYPQD